MLKTGGYPWYQKHPGDEPTMLTFTAGLVFGFALGFIATKLLIGLGLRKLISPEERDYIVRRFDRSKGGVR